MLIQTWVIILVLILLLFAFSNQIFYIINAAKISIISIITGRPDSCVVDDDDLEKLINDPKDNSVDTYQPTSTDTLTTLGYGSDNLPWEEVIQTTELDPSTFTNHNEFVKDVRRFSSGANFTSVTDDNTNLVFTNFIGLRRPSAPLDMIGGTARQIPDVSE